MFGCKFVSFVGATKSGLPFLFPPTQFNFQNKFYLMYQVNQYIERWFSNCFGIWHCSHSPILDQVLNSLSLQLITDLLAIGKSICFSCLGHLIWSVSCLLVREWKDFTGLVVSLFSKHASLSTSILVFVDSGPAGTKLSGDECMNCLRWALTFYLLERAVQYLFVSSRFGGFTISFHFSGLVHASFSPTHLSGWNSQPSLWNRLEI